MDILTKILVWFYEYGPIVIAVFAVFWIVAVCVKIAKIEKKIDTLYVIIEHFHHNQHEDYEKIGKLESEIKLQNCDFQKEIAELKGILHVDEYGEWKEEQSKKEVEKLVKKLDFCAFLEREK